jgi:fimbrial chaperone protein
MGIPGLRSPAGLQVSWRTNGAVRQRQRPPRRARAGLERHQVARRLDDRSASTSRCAGRSCANCGSRARMPLSFEAYLRDRDTSMNKLLRTRALPQWLRASSFLLLLACASAATAAPFEIAVSPSRFEVSGKSGVRLGQSLDIHNLASAATEVSVRTIDWSYSADGNITYHDDLQPGSCRPWVALERRSVTVPARGKKSFRFQIDPPAGSPRGECRFMIAIEGTEPAQQTIIQGGGASLSLPVTGRIAVAVYVMLDGAEPKLEMKQIASSQADGKRRTIVTVTNTGDAHGRLDGSLDATDARAALRAGARGHARSCRARPATLALQPKARTRRPRRPEPVYPLKASGTLDWDKGSFKVDAELKLTRCRRHAQGRRCPVSAGTAAARAHVPRDSSTSSTTVNCAPQHDRPSLEFTLSIQKFLFFRRRQQPLAHAVQRHREHRELRAHAHDSWRAHRAGGGQQHSRQLERRRTGLFASPAAGVMLAVEVRSNAGQVTLRATATTPLIERHQHDSRCRRSPSPPTTPAARAG